jgi:hypothetical protein
MCEGPVARASVAPAGAWGNGGRSTRGRRACGALPPGFYVGPGCQGALGCFFRCPFSPPVCSLGLSHLSPAKPAVGGRGKASSSSTSPIWGLPCCAGARLFPPASIRVSPRAEAPLAAFAANDLGQSQESYPI